MAAGRRRRPPPQSAPPPTPTALRTHHDYMVPNLLSCDKCNRLITRAPDKPPDTVDGRRRRRRHGFDALTVNDETFALYFTLRIGLVIEPNRLAAHQFRWCGEQADIGSR